MARKIRMVEKKDKIGDTPLSRLVHKVVTALKGEGVAVGIELKVFHSEIETWIAGTATPSQDKLKKLYELIRKHDDALAQELASVVNKDASSPALIDATFVVSLTRHVTLEERAAIGVMLKCLLVLPPKEVMRLASSFMQQTSEVDRRVHKVAGSS